jgi:hypothetical protein
MSQLTCLHFEFFIQFLTSSALEFQRIFKSQENISVASVSMFNDFIIASYCSLCNCGGWHHCCKEEFVKEK